MTSKAWKCVALLLVFVAFSSFTHYTQSRITGNADETNAVISKVIERVDTNKKEDSLEIQKIYEHIDFTYKGLSERLDAIESDHESDLLDNREQVEQSL